MKQPSSRVKEERIMKPKFIDCESCKKQHKQELKDQKAKIREWIYRNIYYLTEERL